MRLCADFRAFEFLSGFRVTCLGNEAFWNVAFPIEISLDLDSRVSLEFGVFPSSVTYKNAYQSSVNVYCTYAHTC